MASQKSNILTRKLVLDFLAKHKLMVVATYAKFPWIATVYYAFDNDLNIYFLSSPRLLSTLGR